MKLRSPKGRTIRAFRLKHTERATRVLKMAEEEARRYSHNYMGQEHILLGLVREHEGIAAVVLSTLGVNEDRVRAHVEYVVGHGDRSFGGTCLPLTQRAKQALELAVNEAEDLGHSYVGTEHLLLGILREGTGVGSAMLERMDVDLERARAGVIRALLAAGSPVEATRTRVLTVRLSDRDVDAIDALVEVGVRSTRSDAAAWLIGMAIDSNPDLIKRARAAVTDIRRLRGETQAEILAMAPESSDEAGSDGEAE
jgi:ATP-dependent Clp protease ATP-binding subunit ClpC